MSLSKFKTNSRIEKEGVLVDYGPNEDLPDKPQMRFRVARSGGANVAHEKALEQLTKPLKKMIQTGNLSNTQAKDIQRKAFLQTCLLGWEGVSMPGSSEPLKFTKENAEALFKVVPDVLADLIETAANASAYREEQLEADLGNSGGSLSTDSSRDP